jgi:hypothetical protein
MTETPNIELLGNGVQVGDQHIDTLAHGAAQRLRELFGPIVSSYVFPGVGRAAQLLACGLILLLDEETDGVKSLMVCFDARDASPYPAFPEVPIFTAAIEFGGQRVGGPELESSLLRIPGVSRMAGLVRLKMGELSIGFHTKKRQGRFGKRTGPRRLVLLNAEWGGVKPFGFRGAQADGRKG